MFGYFLVKTERYRAFKQYEAEHLRLTQVKRFFAGWADLDIIWSYIQKEDVGGVDLCRKKYAKARGTNIYGKHS